MKEITRTSRLAGQLENLYHMLNTDFFSGELDQPVITVQRTSKVYGHYTHCDPWDVKGIGCIGINIGAGMLNSGVEHITATLLHEMCHQYNDTVLNQQDCSRNGTYHNKLFRAVAISHGLTVTKSEQYGYSITSPSEMLHNWIVDNNIQEIKLNRVQHNGEVSKGNYTIPTPSQKPSNRLYACPQCHAMVRATEPLSVACGACMRPMVER